MGRAGSVREDCGGVRSLVMEESDGAWRGMLMGGGVGGGAGQG